MAVQGNVSLNFRANDVKAFTNLPGNSALKYDWRVAFGIDADEVWRGSMALAAGTLTFSLESLARTNQAALDLTGLNVLLFILYNRVGNAVMKVADAATNPYPIVGGVAAPTGGCNIGPGGLRFFHNPLGFGTVSTTVSDITVSGTGTQVFEMLILAKDLS